MRSIYWEAAGRHEACPYRFTWRIATTVGEAQEGRHKACPYIGGPGVRTAVGV